MDRNKIKAVLLLVLATFILGSSFVAQKEGSSSFGPFTFNCLRSAVATVFLFSLYFIKRLLPSKEGERKTVREDFRANFRPGIICGVALIIATTTQQMGISYEGVSTGMAGFLTALYVILVPLIGMLFGKKMTANMWVGSVLGFAGMFLICLSSRQDGSFSAGHILLIVCALFFSLHILAIGKYAPECDTVLICAVQFALVTLVTLPLMLIFEHLTWDSIVKGIIPLLYAGVLSSGIAYTLQAFSQKYLHPAVASLIFCLESVFALLSGMVVLNERPSVPELIGCCVIFAGIVITELRFGKRRDSSV